MTAWNDEQFTRRLAHANEWLARFRKPVIPHDPAIRCLLETLQTASPRGTRATRPA